MKTKEQKQELRKNNKQDREQLFNAAWRKILAFDKESEIDDLQGLYDMVVAELVNNPRSKYYIYG